MLDELITLGAAAIRVGKALDWIDGTDPLVFDLDGDGLETIAIEDADVRFDVDGDLFAEATGWLDGDDGFLALDHNLNGLIDSVDELFGGRGRFGLEELADYDDNADGVIDAADAVWSDLLMWRDRNSDAISQPDELVSLAAVDIVSIRLDGVRVDTVTPQGTTLRDATSFTRTDGSEGLAFEAIFEMDDVDTRFAGEAGRAAWLAADAPDSRGFGRVADLSIAMSNDFALAEAATATAAAMTTPKLSTLVAQSAETFGLWGAALEQTRELTPVLLGADGALLDRGVWAEDDEGGYWTLVSGAAVLDAEGAPIARPSLDDVLAQAPGGDTAWRLEQVWSPSDWAAPLEHREAVPYLAELVDGRAVVRDRGVEGEDGLWRLASGDDIVDADGRPIVAPTREDILAMPVEAGFDWRLEALGHNPYAAIPVEAVGINFIDGQVVDYTVEVTDRDGTFHVWARNLDRALELQAKVGTPRDFVLRNYEVDFDTLDEVGSADDSAFRVEVLTPAQLQFATSLAGVDFVPAMLSATIDETDGTIAYSVNETGEASLSEDAYVSGIDGMIELLGPVMDLYVESSRAFAVRLAFQGGLDAFAGSLAYDLATDTWRPTTDRELAPLFEAIFEAAPDGYDAAYKYLQDWNEILWHLYPDYQLDGSGNLFGATVGIDQAFVMQMMLPAFENPDIEIDLDLAAVMNALSIDETRLRSHAPGEAAPAGTRGTDFFHMTGGDQVYAGGRGSDVYFAGRDFGDDVIVDRDSGGHDELRFTDVASSEVTAERRGQDLFLTIEGRPDAIRIEDQFKGELNVSLGNQTVETGVGSIVFADGVIWDRFRMAMEVADPRDTPDTIIGSGSGDVLWGGKGNDVLRGGAGGDLYIYARGDGEDTFGETVENDLLSLLNDPSTQGIDFVQFQGDDLSADDVYLERVNPVETLFGRNPGRDLRVTLLDEDGNPTDDVITIEDQFAGIALNLGALATIDERLAIDYVSINLIERFTFEDGTSIDFQQMAERVLANARTDGDDAIYGFLMGDTLDGGAGADFMSGLEGGDTYLFGPGAGNDVLRDDDRSVKIFGSDPDRLRFTDDVRWTDITFGRLGASDTLTLTVTETGDTVTLDENLKREPFLGYLNLIEEIEFGDGTLWSYTKLHQHVIDLAKTDEADHIHGFALADVLDGGKGDDRLEGKGGSDTYLFTRGDGTDTILDAAGADRVILDGITTGDIALSRTDLDLIITIEDTGDRLILENQYVRDGAQRFAVEVFQFDDREVGFIELNPRNLDLLGDAGEDTLTGSNLDETFDGRAGDDTLTGRDGGDTYRFDVGYGHDVIVDRQERASWTDRRGVDVPAEDTVAFGGGVAFGDAVFSKDGDDLLVRINNRPADSLRIRNQFRDLADGVERFTFYTGEVLSIRDVEQRLNIEGGDYGDNEIEGVLDSPNVLDGRQGDDTLRGGDQGDTYVFTGGYDFDTIVERPDAPGVIDRVRFGATVRAEDLVIRRRDDDLLIDLGNATDVLTIKGGLGTTRIERFDFADGIEWTLDDVRERLLTGTDGNDALTGFDDRDDDLAGGAGSDAMAGGQGDDTYRFGYGDGRDSVEDTGGDDRVVFAAGVERGLLSFRAVNDDLVIALAGTNDDLVILGGAAPEGAPTVVETFELADGSTIGMDEVRAVLAETRANTGADRLDARGADANFDVRPGPGFDDVVMDATTRVVIEQGGGLDRITPPATVGTAEIVFEDLASVAVEVRLAGLDSDDLVVADPATGDQVTLVGARTAALPPLRFADGVVWDRAGLMAALTAAQASEDADVIVGSDLADTIVAGEGDDEVRAGDGDDTVVFTRGDGRDVILDTAGEDTLEIRGYRLEDLVVRRALATRDDELVLGFTDSDDEIVLRYGADEAGIERVVFGDGTELDKAALFDRAPGTVTPGDDVIEASDRANTLTGGRGYDILRGEGGDDVYVFRRGDGVDWAIERSIDGGLDVLSLPDHAPRDVQVVLVPPSNHPAPSYMLRLGGGDAVMLPSQGYTHRGGRFLDRIEFGSGDVWSAADLDAALERAFAPSDTGGPAILRGTSGADWIVGTPADEEVAAGGGSDTYVFARGGGRDVWLDDVDYRTSERIRFEGYTLDEAVFERAPEFHRDLVVRFPGTGDALYIVQGLNVAARSNGTRLTEAYWNIDAFEFDDAILSYEQLIERLIAEQITDGPDFVLGTEAEEVIEPGPGDDVYVPDFQQGGSLDIYVFNRGDGRDTILAEAAPESGGVDRTRLELRGYAPDEVTVLADPFGPGSYALVFDGTDDRIDLPTRLRDGFYREIAINTVAFDDDTTWTVSALASRAVAAPAPLVADRVVGTPGDDFLRGSAADETFVPGPGDDAIVWRGRSDDTVVFRRGDGVDYLGANEVTSSLTISLPDFLPGDVDLIDWRDLGDAYVSDAPFEIRAREGGDRLFVAANVAIVWADDSRIDRLDRAASLVPAADRAAPAPGAIDEVYGDFDDEIVISTAANEWFVDRHHLNYDTTRYHWEPNGDHDTIDDTADPDRDTDRVYVSVLGVPFEDVVVQRLAGAGPDAPGDLLLIANDASLRLVGAAGDGAIAPSSRIDSVSFREDRDSDGSYFGWRDASVTKTLEELEAAAVAFDPTGSRVSTGTLAFTRGVETGLYQLLQNPAATGPAVATLVDVVPDEVTPRRQGDAVVLEIASREADGSDAGAIWLGAVDRLSGVEVRLDGGVVLDGPSLADGLSAPVDVRRDLDDETVASTADDEWFVDLHTPVPETVATYVWQSGGGHDRIDATVDPSEQVPDRVVVEDVASDEIIVQRVADEASGEATDLLLSIEGASLRLVGAAADENGERETTIGSVAFADDTTRTIADLDAAALAYDPAGARIAVGTLAFTRGTDAGVYQLLPDPQADDARATLTLLGVEHSEIAMRRLGDDVALEIAPRAVDGGDAATLWIGTIDALDDVVVRLDDGTTIDLDDLRTPLLMPEERWTSIFVGTRPIWSDEDFYAYDGVSTTKDEWFLDAYEDDYSEMTYRWTRDGGHDVIEGVTTAGERDDGYVDRVVVEDASVAEVTVQRLANPAPDRADDLLLSVDGASLRLVGAAADEDGLPTTADVVEVEFADGTRTIEALQAEALAYDPDGARIGIGTLAFERGVSQGAYQLLPDPNTPNAASVLTLVDVAADEVTARRQGDAVVLDIAARAPDASDAGTIWLGPVEALADIEIRLDGGALLTIETQDLDGYLLYEGSDDDDILTEYAERESEVGYAPWYDGAIFEPGRGDDVAVAEARAPVLRYRRGDGHDLLITDEAARVDLVDIRRDEASVRLLDDLRVLISIPESAAGAGDGGQVLVLPGRSRMPVGEIVFAGGELLTPDAFDDDAIYAPGVSFTPGDDVASLIGTSELIVPGTGHDRLSGFIGHPTIAYASGDGHDVLDLADGTGLTIVFADHALADHTLAWRGADLIVTLAGDAGRGLAAGSVTLTGAVEALHDKGGALRFADGATLSLDAAIRDRAAGAVSDGDDRVDTRVIGPATDGVVEAGPGDDVIVGDPEHAETYVWRHGDGDDTLFDDASPSVVDDPIDTLRLVGVTRDLIAFSVERRGLVVEVFESRPGAGDGGRLLLVDMLEGSDDTGVERLVLEDSTLDRDAIATALAIPRTTAFADRLTGTTASETLSGGRGDDRIEGGGGSDTYVYTRGHGDDLIVPSRNAGDVEVLRLRDIVPSDVTVRRQTDFSVSARETLDRELDLWIEGDGVTPRARISIHQGARVIDGYGIEEVRFDDGMVWSKADLIAMADAAASRASDDPDRLDGTLGADTLEGRLGDDVLDGKAGDDLYRYTRGDGADTILEPAGFGDTDTLEIAGYTPGEIDFARRGVDGRDLIVRLADPGDEITIVDDLAGTSPRIERIVLADTGEIIDRTAIARALIEGAAGDGDDIVVGTAEADTLTGGPGADLLSGREGADVYVYRAGDGDDRIDDWSDRADDRVVLADYTPADVVYALRAGPDSHDLVLRFTGERDRLIIAEALAEPWSNDDAVGVGPGTVEFADSTIWTRDTLRERTLLDAATDLDDSLYGFEGDDALAGGAGDDLLAGGAGSDTYTLAAGDGHDTVDDRSTADGEIDRVVFENAVSAEIAVERLYKGSDTVVLRAASHPDDSLTVVDALAEDGRGIEEFVFTDTTWTRETLLERLANEAPTAMPDGYYTATAGEAITIAAGDLLANDFDADGDDLRLLVVDGGAHGTAERDANGDVVYTPASGFFGPTTFSYVLADARGGQATASVDVRVRPVAEARDDRGFIVAEDETLVIEALRLLSNDVDGDRMVISAVDGESTGVAARSGGDITFTPGADFNGTATFAYVANTPEGGRAEAVVHVEVTPVNDAPVASDDDGFTTLEDVALAIDTADLLANDADVDGDTLAVTDVTSSADLAVELADDGVVVATPRAFFWGETSFGYTVADGQGATAEGRVSVYVEPVNNTPEPRQDLIETIDGAPILEDASVVLATADLLANDLERDGDPLAVTAVSNAFGGTAELLDNDTVLFTPNIDFFGTASFSYTVDDGQGATAEAPALIAYQAVNDRPTARDDGPFTGPEDVAIDVLIAELMLNDTDREGDAIAFETFANPVNGIVELVGGTTLRFTPDRDYWGPASFTYQISDEDGAPDDATVELTFTNVSDAPPEAIDDTVQVFEDVPTVIVTDALIANDVDIDRDPLSFASYRLPSGLELIFPGKLDGTLETTDSGDLLFTPDADVEKTAGFFYTVAAVDGADEGFVDIEIIAQPDDPTVVDDQAASTPLDVPLVIRVADLLEDDFDVDEDDVVAFDAIVATSTGTAEVVADTNGDPEFVVLRTPAGYAGPVTLTYRVKDTTARTDTGLVTSAVDEDYDATLTGTPERDLLIGNALDETITGEAGDDDLYAEAGDDTIDAGPGADRVWAGPGDDLILASDGADRIDAGPGEDTVDYAASPVGLRADLEGRTGFAGFAEGDAYVGVENLAGSRWADEIEGDTAANRLDGRDGDDVLRGRGGDDALTGGDGDDVLAGGPGADRLDGGEGSDTASYWFEATAGVAISLADATAASGEATGDVLVSIENLEGTDFDDTLTGDAADNALIGRRGDDTLIGGAGDDVLYGGRGADALIGGTGIDVADYTLSLEGVTIDLADASAGGGDALGDTLNGIEIVRGSFHDDIARGNEVDNLFRMGRGADTIDGRGGLDTADYTEADEAVTVDLATGQGLAGEALGDVLISVERLVGSVHADTLLGSAGPDVFEAGFGDDRIEGRAGADTYAFGYDSGADTVIEAGSAGDVDRVVLGQDITPSDLSVIRRGDDLLLELERDAGFLIDTLAVPAHFLAAENGIEQVVFADGTVWDRDAMAAIARTGRFNAADDIVPLGLEDTPVTIDPADLFANDAEDGVDELTLVSVQDGVDGTAWIEPNGSITFLGAPDHFGDAFFDYTVADGFGRRSTARVEVNLGAVNDAPIGVDDPGLAGVEDTELRIPVADLLANDIDVEGDALNIVDLGPLLDLDGRAIDAAGDWPLTNGKGRVVGDEVVFQPLPDHFGAAGFTYTVADIWGATSTAAVELTIAPVNDAPRYGEDGETIRLGPTTAFAVADLIANDTDPEGDAITFTGIGDATNGTVALSGGQVLFTPEALGTATFEYSVIDALGAAATFTVELEVIPLNDPPEARDDHGLETVEDTDLVIDPATLLANDTDPDGDPLTVTALERFPQNGTVAFGPDGTIVFTPRENFNGPASFLYEIADGRGGTDRARAHVTILPDNDPAILVDDVTIAFEDVPFAILAAEAFGNDIEPEGDVLFFEDAAVHGLVDPGYLSEPTVITATLGDGTALPGWLAFDPDAPSLAGDVPADVTEPFDVRLSLFYPEEGATLERTITIDPAEADALAAGLAVEDVLPPGYRVRAPFSADFEYALPDTGVSVSATMADGTALPAGLAFDPATATLKGALPDGTSEPVEVVLAFTANDPASGESVAWQDALVIDPADPEALAAGIAWDPDIAVLDIAGTTASAALANHRPLPAWLDFDAETRQLVTTDVVPDPDAEVARVRIAFTPPATETGPGEVALDDGPVALEVVVDPALGIDPAVNALLAGTPFFEAQGLLAVPLGAMASVTALKANNGPLPGWLGFDAEALALGGTPPAAFVGAVPVRLDIAGSDTLPDLALIADAVIDPRYTLLPAPQGLSVAVEPERLPVATPEDFNGTIVLTYTTTDEKGAVSPEPGRIVVTILPTRETPDAEPDTLDAVEDQTLVVDLAVLTANDRDDDGDAFRVVAVGQPAHGTLTVETVPVVLAAPTPLPILADGTYTATRADGTALPDWAAIDPATGTLTLTPPLAAAGPVAFAVTVANATTTASATVETVLAPDVGARLVYTPDPEYSGPDGFEYVITDDREGEATGLVTIRVAPRNDPPIARDDYLDGLEDTVSVIDPLDLLANDEDVDGDPLSLLAVGEAVNGSVVYADGEIRFTPIPDYDGPASFSYTVTDGTDGEATARVTIDVISTNLAPVVTDDLIETPEDVPVVFSIDDLLADDTDGDGDALSFVSIRGSVEGARLFTLPGGRFQFVADENVSGTFVFPYRVTDGRLDASGDLVVEVAPVNDAPIANPDGPFETAEDTEIAIPLADLLANDRDVEGDAFALTAAFDGDNGSVRLDGDSAVFTPDPDTFGNAAFKYTLTDTQGAESTGSVSLTVFPENDLPIPIADSGYEVLEDGAIVIDEADLLANDIDPDGDTLTILGLTAAGPYALDDLGGGLWQITPEPDFFGSIVVGYAVTDEADIPVASSVRIEVLAVEDDPVAGADALAGQEDTVLTIGLGQILLNDTDPDGPRPAFDRVIATDGVSVETTADGEMIVTPDPDRFGLAFIDYTVIDATGRVSEPGRITVTLAPVNDAPTIAALDTIEGTEDTAVAGELPLDAFDDIEGDPLAVSVQAAGGGALPAWLSFDRASLGLTGQPPQDLNGEIALEVVAFDGTDTTIAPLTLRLAPVNDAPVARDDAYDAGIATTVTIPAATLLANDTDVDGDALTITAVTAPDGLDVAFGIRLDDAGELVIERDPALEGLIEIGYTASDGALVAEATLALTLEVANTAPVIGPIDDIEIDEDSAIELALAQNLVTDAEGDTLALALVRPGGAAAPDWLAFDPETMRITGTPPADLNGTIALALAAGDGRKVVERAFDLVIRPVNDAPRLSGPFSDRTAEEDTPFSIALQRDLISDPEGDPITLDLRAEDGTARPGWLDFDAETMTLSGQAPADFYGPVALRLYAGDGVAEISDDFTLEILGRPDAPRLVTPLADRSTDDAGARLATGVPFTLTAQTDAFSDPDDDPLGFAATLDDGSALPDWLGFDGTAFTGTAPKAAAGTLEIALSATDGTETATGTFALDIESRNSAPIANGDVFDATVPDRLLIAPEALLANDTDADGEALAITAIGPATHGSVSLTEDGVLYDPGIDFEGADQFGYTVTDGIDTASATVTVRVANPFDSAVGGDGFVSGGRGDDLVQGSDGRDILLGGAGDDRVQGGAGRDRLFGGFGDDRLEGGEGDDRLYASLGDDRLEGGAGDDRLYGGLGRDVLDGGPGRDTLVGGLGGDSFRFSTGDGQDTIRDFQAGFAVRRGFIAGDEIRLDVDGVDSFADLLAVAREQRGGVLLDFGDGDELFLRGTRLAALDANQFSFY